MRFMQFRKRPAKIQGVSITFDAVLHRERSFRLRQFPPMTFSLAMRIRAAPDSA
jgi:hypothetical protein